MVKANDCIESILSLHIADLGIRIDNVLNLINFLEIWQLLNNLAFQFVELFQFFLFELFQSCQLIGLLELQFQIVHSVALGIAVVLLPFHLHFLEVVVEGVSHL